MKENKRLQPEHEVKWQVDEAMDSLDGITRAKANPFLFTRVEAKLRYGGKSTWEKVTSYVSRPVVALAMLCMVIASNAVVMYWSKGLPMEQSSSNEETYSNEQVAMTDEYNMTVSSFYDDENPEP